MSGSIRRTEFVEPVEKKKRKMNSTQETVIANPVLKESMRGITREINARTWKIQSLVDCITGREERFFKPVKKQLPVMEKALRLRREVIMLQEIKKSLRSKLHANETH